MMNTAMRTEADRRGGVGAVWVGVTVVLGVLGGAAAADDATVVLKESSATDRATVVRIELKAGGLFRPGLPPDAMTDEAKMPKPLDIDIQTRLIFRERLLATPKGADAGGARSSRAVRLVSQAASAINGEIRPTALELRKELSLLIAERDDPDGTVTVVSPSGSLTRAELELVQGLGDPLSLGDLLPEGPVAKGAKWPVRKSALAAISGYDTIKSSKVEAVVESITADHVRIGITGEIQGMVLGGPGTLTCEGFATFDRKSALIDRVELTRNESRQPGPIEAGLDLKSTLTIARRETATPAELSDAALDGTSLDLTPARKLLQLIAFDGRYNLLHDRTWHTYWDDPKLVVLKRFLKDRITAQCNFSNGPPAGKGKHQDVEEFRADVRRAMKDRFVQFLGAGEVEGEADGGFRYKLGVQGREGDLGLRWYYYLIASPRGEQLLATFTLAESDAKDFAEDDVALVGSLQWNDPPLPVKH
ncbi:MAG: hypothetical protein P4L85_11810 [Paludisphaera borealis]|uniref:hypothetical protein n=1 Tax=Paludisphaera borealis TaxID=1387353 RepID=UPI00285057FF|nr:hypothetical protein [Paludisphaera borealis]MDR3620027.1 hypothetical protein [Paludisphaera borealis]